MKVISKIMALGTLIALTLAAVSVTSVFATSRVPKPGPESLDIKLQSAWKTKLSTLQRYKFLDNQIAKWIHEWLTTNRSHRQRSRQNSYANEVKLALQQAEIIAGSHAGFDAQGRVINKMEAAQSVRNLALYLRKLHFVFIHKFHHRLHK